MIRAPITVPTPIPAFAAVLSPAWVEASWPGLGGAAELVSSGSEREDVVANVSEVGKERVEYVNTTLDTTDCTVEIGCGGNKTESPTVIGPNVT
jgi:hypothetical protein